MLKNGESKFFSAREHIFFVNIFVSRSKKAASHKKRMLQQKDDSAGSNPSWNTKIFFFSDWLNFWYIYAFDHGEYKNKNSFFKKNVCSHLDSNQWPKDCCAAFPALGRRRKFLKGNRWQTLKNIVRCRKKFWIE